jgi:hypothetical protein
LTRRAGDGKLAAVPIALNSNAIVMCPHCGVFKLMTIAPTVMINGSPAVTFPGSGVPQTPCPFATPAGPAPCVSLTPPMVGSSMKVMVQGKPLLLQNSMWMTVPAGAGAPVPAQVTFPGATTVNVNG